MHKIQATSGNYVFLEDVNEHNNKARRASRYNNALSGNLQRSASIRNFSGRNKLTAAENASKRWSMVAEKVKGGEDMSKYFSRSPPRLERHPSLSSVAFKVMNLKAPELAINKEIKKLHKLQAKIDKQESMQMDEAREYARRVRNRELLESSKPLKYLAWKKKISLLDTKGKKLPPIERFQKIVRLLCFLLKIKNSTDRKYKQQQHSVVFEQLEELSETVVCNDDGMVFDPNYFKAVKEIKLSQDAVQILSMLPGTRTEDQLQAALVGLKASVAAFGEYPLKMQRRLVTVGWYESFEAKRVIIRQGHRAENFYFILSGTALVTLLVNDSATGEQRSTTIAVLGKGSSFGELALLHHKTRSATVLCRNEVALLAVGREDFRDIFMSYEDGKAPEHIQFLRTVPFMKDLPLDQCSTRPDVCIFHYFRRGVVIVKNSKAEWIYIIKSGSCRVLTNLIKKKAVLPTSSGRASANIMHLPSIPVDEFERRKLLYTASGERMHSRTAWSPDYKRPRTESPIKTNQEKRESLALPVILTPDQEKFKKTVKKVNFALPWLERLNQKDAQEELESHRQRIETLHNQLTSTSLMKKNTNLSQDQDNKSYIEKNEHVCVQIELLKPKDQFGLATILYDNQAVKCHLVSNGAECILIQKNWFLQNASESLLRELRAQVPPYPTQETLEQNLQDQANWESFKTQTINDLLDTLHL